MAYFCNLILYYFYLMRFPKAKRFEKTRSFVQKHLESGMAYKMRKAIQEKRLVM